MHDIGRGISVSESNAFVHNSRIPRCSRWWNPLGNYAGHSGCYAAAGRGSYIDTSFYTTVVDVTACEKALSS